MKKVILICLLSISICMSRPDGTPESAPKGPANKPSTPIHNDTTTVAQTPKESPTIVNEMTIPPTPLVVTDNTTKTINDTNKTTDKNETAKLTDVTTVTDKPTPTTPPVPEKGNPTTPDHTMKNVTTIVVPTTVVTPTTKPTTMETPKATDAPPMQARGFDGPSFIGGIILTLGLLAIGFMGFKYYKNHTEGIYNPLS